LTGKEAIIANLPIGRMWRSYVGDCFVSRRCDFLAMTDKEVVITSLPIGRTWWSHLRRLLCYARN